MKTIFLLLLCCVPVAAQTQTNLRNNYGTPVSSEIYEARPNVSLTVTYGKEEQICSMKLEPKFAKEKLPEPTISSLLSIVDELVPVGTRGENQVSGFFTSPDVSGSYLNYEKLKIWQSTDQYKNISVSVVWKDKGCGYFEERREWKFSDIYKQEQ